MSIFDKKIIYFISVVEEGSFSAAAKKHFVSQANLSKQIAQLENDIGVELFNRNGYRPVLTDAGKYLYDKLTTIKEKEDELLDGLKKYGSVGVKAGFTGLFENRELIDGIRKYQDDHPGYEIDMIPVDDFGRGGAKFNQIALMEQLNSKNINKIGEVKLVSDGDTVSFEKLDGTKLDLEYDNVILSLGVRPNQEKVSAFNDLDAEVINVGDCNTRIGTLFNAVHTAHEAASII